MGAVDTIVSEHLYCAAIAFKMTEQIEQQISSNFALSLNIPSMETLQMIQKAAAMGNWWLAASSWQCTHSCITPCAELFGKTSNHPGNSALCNPDLVPCNFWLSTKLKSPLKGKRFQTIYEIQENMTGQLMAIGKTVWGPKVPTLKGTEVSLS